MSNHLFRCAVKMMCVFLFVLGLPTHVHAQDAGQGFAECKEQAPRIQAAEKAVEKVKKRWEQLQKERDAYAAKTQDVGTRWASTTLQMYWVTRSKEMREKELKAEENDAYWKWRFTQKGKRESDLTMEDWKRTSEGHRLLKKNDKIRDELNDVSIKAINELDRTGFKGDDGNIQALDRKQQKILAEFQRAREHLERLRKECSDEALHKAAPMIFNVMEEDVHLNVNETAKISYWIIDGTPPMTLRVSSTDGEISQEITITTTKKGSVHQSVPVKFSKPGTRTVSLDLSDSSMPRQTKIIPVVFFVSGPEEKAKKPEIAKTSAQDRRIALVAAETTPSSLKVGQKTSLAVRYSVQGILPDERLKAMTKVVVTGPAPFPFSGKAKEFSGAKAKDGTAQGTIEASAAFAKAGDYLWNYTVDIPGYPPLQGKVPFSIQEKETTKPAVKPRAKRIFLDSVTVTPRTGKSGDTFEFRLIYGVDGLSATDVLDEEFHFKITGPASAVKEPFHGKVEGRNAKADGISWRTLINKPISPIKPGVYTLSYVVKVSGFAPLKGSVKLKVQPGAVAAPPPAPAPPANDRFACDASGAGHGGVPAICMYCPISMGSQPISISYKDSAGDITNLLVHSVLKWSGQNDAHDYTISVAQEMKGTSGTYKWPGIIDQFPTPSTIDLSVSVADKAGNRSNSSTCSMLIAK